MDLLVRSTTVEADATGIEMTAEIVWVKPVTHSYLIGGHWAYSTYCEMGLYGEVTTSDPDQIMRLQQWFINGSYITEDQLFGKTEAIKGAA